MNEEKNTHVVTTREKWIDILKGIGIILVVIGHVNKENVLVDWIYTFHMPLFFALSGYLLYKSKKYESFKQFLIKRTRTILWPYVLFRILLVVYWLLVESHFRELDIGPIWFLIVLYFVEIVAYLLLVVCGKSYLRNIISFLLVIVIWYAMKVTMPENIIKPWTLRFVDGLLWFLAGYLCSMCERSIKDLSINNNHKMILLLCLFVSSLWFGYFNSGVSLWSNLFGKSYWMFIVGGIIGCLWLGLLCKWYVTNNAVLERIGQNTITIMAVHEPIKRIVLKCTEVLMNLLGIRISITMIQENILYSILIVLVVLLLCLVLLAIIRLLKSKLPQSIGNKYLSFVR